MDHLFVKFPEFFKHGVLFLLTEILFGCREEYLVFFLYVFRIKIDQNIELVEDNF
jgi:hypothetical protein